MEHVRVVAVKHDMAVANDEWSMLWHGEWEREEPYLSRNGYGHSSGTVLLLFWYSSGTVLVLCWCCSGTVPALFRCCAALALLRHDSGGALLEF